MNWQKEPLLKTLQHSFAKTQLPYPKKYVLTAFLIGITKELFIMPETFAPIVTIVKRPMSVERYFFVVLNVLPVQHAIRPVGISRKNAVKGLIKLHIYVTDVLRRSIIAQSHISIVMMPDMQIENIENY